MSRADFAAAYALDAAHLARFDRYAALIAEWQERMNLVAASTLPDLWQRHFADSAQLSDLVSATETPVWLDIGSGAGLPALVLALLRPGRFHLVEARGKKCTFLQAAVDMLDLADRVTIHAERIEDMVAFSADVITARATASLAQLFAWGMPFGRGARWLLPKGRSAAEEVSAAAREFTFDHHLVPSRTASDARIVVAERVRRRR